MRNSNFGAFVKKETLHILRDVRTMMIVLLIPVILMILFGFAISTEVNNLNVAVVAPDRTETVRKSVERLVNNSYFTFKGYISQDEIDSKLRSSEVDAVVVFEHDFDKIMMEHQLGIETKPAMQFIFDASNTNVASAGTVYLQSVMMNDISQQSLFEMRLLYNPQMKSAYNFVPGIMGLIFILICAMMTSVSIVREKEIGTMEVLLVSPVSPMKIVFAKMIPYFVISCINLATILLISHFILDVPMSGNLLNIIVLSVTYLFLSLALGLFVSSISTSQVMALLISAMVMLLPMMMLSGMVFPLENLPLAIKPLTYIVPARWYIEAIRKLMIMGTPFMAVIKEFIILIVMTLILLLVSIKLFKDKLE
ncbi:MAG: ABC transporter permease [Bacteroidales bacterium]|nr:ABC transporter permease [Bacteroidales bacterium]